MHEDLLPRPEVRYLALFAWEGSPAEAGWTDAAARPEPDFFLESARLIFEPSQGAPNAAGVRVLEPSGRDGETAYLFPGGVGILVLEEDPPDGPLWSHLRLQADASARARRALDDLLPGRWRPSLYGQRLLTWTLHPVSGDPLRLAYGLTQHRDPEAPNRVRAEALKRLAQRQGYGLWTSWSVLYHRDNAAVLVDRDLAVAHDLQRQRHELFRMYLLCLYLKARLSRFLEDLAGRLPAQHHTIEEESAHLGQIYEEHYEQYLQFQTNDWFEEVTRRTTGRGVYRVMRRALGLRPLLRELRSEIRLLRQAWTTKFRKVERDRDRRHRDRADADSKRLGLITTYALPFLAATGAMGMNLPFPGTTGEDHHARWLWFLGFLALAAAAVQGFLRPPRPSTRTSAPVRPSRRPAP